jgi:L-ascorbate metabolism protein UlaG (beta-lactamase superfamily)
MSTESKKHPARLQFAKAIPPGDTAGVSRRDLLRWTAGAIGAGLAGPAARATTDTPPAPRLRAQRLAWAGVRLELASTTLFVDPLVDPGVWAETLSDPLLPLASEATDRFVLVTHLHPDHFDPRAVAQALGEGGTLVCDASVAAEAGSRGFRVRGARAYEPLLLGELTATAVPAVDGYGTSQVSWVIAGGGRRVFHGGDTLWHGHWWQIGRQLGPFDAAFLPVNGARFGWRLPAAEVPSVMTPEQAVAAAVVLGARLLVPIHYGVRGASGYAEEPEAAARTVMLAARRGLAASLVVPGEWVRWPEEPAEGQ